MNVRTAILIATIATIATPAMAGIDYDLSYTTQGHATDMFSGGSGLWHSSQDGATAVAKDRALWKAVDRAYTDCGGTPIILSEEAWATNEWRIWTFGDWAYHAWAAAEVRYVCPDA